MRFSASFAQLLFPLEYSESSLRPLRLFQCTTSRGPVPAKKRPTPGKAPGVGQAVALHQDHHYDQRQAHQLIRQHARGQQHGPNRVRRQPHARARVGLGAPPAHRKHHTQNARDQDERHRRNAACLALHQQGRNADAPAIHHKVQAHAVHQGTGAAGQPGQHAANGKGIDQLAQVAVEQPERQARHQDKGRFAE